MSERQLIETARAAGSLKEVARRGWIHAGVGAPESVAAHAYRVALLALLLGDRGHGDPLRLVRMALAHDLPEAITGDPIPADGLEPAEKRRREAEAWPAIGGDPSLERAWRAYAGGADAEALLVRDLDKIEMAMQAIAYRRSVGIDPAPFLADAEAGIATEPGRALLRAVREEAGA